MDTIKMLWGFLWRMSLLGVVLGALLGAAYGAALLSLGAVFADLVDTGDMLSNIASRVAAMGLGFVFGAIFGGIFFGIPVGLTLGMLNGLFLSAITRIFYPTVDVSAYRGVAGIACFTASLLILFADWALQSFDPSAFAFSRNYPGLVDRGGTLDLVFVAIIPRFVAACAMWWSGRKAAGWYAREASGSDS